MIEDEFPEQGRRNRILRSEKKGEEGAMRSDFGPDYPLKDENIDLTK